ncbi:MAG: hypothetical protein PHF84_08945, partial [bacterium]|nr:hypothetical protein [bacterium]
IASKLDFFVNIVVRPENLDDLRGNVAFLISQGVRYIRLSYALGVFWDQKAIKKFFNLITEMFTRHRKNKLLVDIEHCTDEPLIACSALTVMPDQELLLGTAYPLLEFFPHIREANSYGRLDDYTSLGQIKRNKRKEIRKSLEYLSKKDDREFFLWANNIHMGILYEELFNQLDNIPTHRKLRKEETLFRMLF